MKAKEKIMVRKEMVLMHEEFLSALDKAMQAENYVEATWLCYSIFEQRITRLIEKHISFCPRKKKTKGVPASITTRISCLKKLVLSKYGGYEFFDKNILIEIEKWCNKRNDLVHGLVSIEHYKKYDSEFKDLAINGKPLVEKLYKEASKFRKWYYAENQFGVFPNIKCRCTQKCIME